MKHTILISSLTVLAAAAIAVADEKSVTTTTTTATTGTGTITEFSPGKTFIMKETSGPVTYRYGEKVTYVTRKGRTLSDEDVRTRIRVGIPANVHYSTVGQDRVITRVEVDDD